MISQKQADEFNYYAHHLVDIFMWYHGHFELVLYALLIIFGIKGIYDFIRTGTRPFFNLVVLPIVIPVISYIGLAVVLPLLILAFFSEMGTGPASRRQIHYEMHDYY